MKRLVVIAALLAWPAVASAQTTAGLGKLSLTLDAPAAGFAVTGLVRFRATAASCAHERMVTLRYLRVALCDR